MLSCVLTCSSRLGTLGLAPCLSSTSVISPHALRCSGVSLQIIHHTYTTSHSHTYIHNQANISAHPHTQPSTHTSNTTPAHPSIHHPPTSITTPTHPPPASHLLRSPICVPAPASSRSCAIRRDPLRALRCRGVRPSLSLAFTTSIRRSSSSSHSLCLHQQAEQGQSGQ